MLGISLVFACHPTDRMVWQNMVWKTLAAQNLVRKSHTREVSGIRGLVGRRQKGLKHFVRQQSPARRETNAILALEQ